MALQKQLTADVETHRGGTEMWWQQLPVRTHTCICTAQNLPIVDSETQYGHLSLHWQSQAHWERNDM